MLKPETYREIWNSREAGFNRSETAELLEINRRTVSRYWDLKEEDIRPITRNRPPKLAKIGKKVKKLFAKHRNCAAVRRELLKAGYEAPDVRTIQRFLKDFRAELAAKEAAEKAGTAG